MKFPCPYCHQSLEALEEHQGLEADCGLCGGTFTVPAPGPSAAKVAGIDPGELFARGMHTVHPPDADSWEPPTPEELARLLPQYNIESIIGRGGMGAVYKGTQERLGRHVAIKLLPSELAEDTNFISRFEREARTLAKLDHPGIIHVHDFGQTSEGHLYFVMEFVDGTDLHQLIRSPGINPGQALEIIGQVCDALQFAHSQGVVHRDIKPANILVNSDGRVKLADFGLARPLKSGISGQLTLSRVIMGTPDYMAPEQKRGEGDHRVDLYALGVMLYEMLCGRTPQGAWQPPSQRVQVDVRLDQVVIKAMQEEPELRYQQASQVKTDVDAIRTSIAKKAKLAPAKSPPAPAKPKPPGTSKSSSKSSSKKPLSIATACLLPMLGFAAWMANRDRTDTGRSEAGKPTPASPGKGDTAASPIKATKEQPFVNSLGMKFVPVPGTDVLFCIHETRYKDYRAYARENPRINLQWKVQTQLEHTITDQPENHPVIFMNRESATAFCEWLGKNEGRTYRLPTHEEWSTATLAGRSVATYPWGESWPPPQGVGNYMDLSTKRQAPEDTARFVFHETYDDKYPTTAPVMSFPPNAFGIFDLGGNVWEWVGGGEPSGRNRNLRGGGWLNFSEEQMRTDFSCAPSHWGGSNGFRCVLVPDGPPLNAVAKSPAPPPASNKTPNPVPPSNANASPSPVVSSSARLQPDGKAADMSKPLKVFILMGSGNMLGWGQVSGDRDGTLDHAVKQQKLYPFLIDESGAWTARRDVRNVRVMYESGMTVHNNEWMTVNGENIGVEFGIGHRLGNAIVEPVMLVKSCIGNRALGWDLLPPGSESFEFTGRDEKTGLSATWVHPGYKGSPERWIKGTTPQPVNWYAGKQYDDDTASAKAVLKDLGTYCPGASRYEVAGFFWWHCERDIASAAHASRYERNLVQLIQQLRKDFNVPDARFVIATPGEASKGSSGNSGRILDAMLAVDGDSGKYPQFKGNVATVYTNPLSKGGSAPTRYNGNAKTYMDIGLAMGEAMVKLLEGK